MTVYLVAGKRRTLHKAVREGAGLLTREGCNLDQTNHAQAEYQDEAIARQAADRVCRRCFPNG